MFFLLFLRSRRLLWLITAIFSLLSPLFSGVRRLSSPSFLRRVGLPSFSPLCAFWSCWSHGFPFLIMDCMHNRFWIWSLPNRYRDCFLTPRLIPSSSILLIYTLAGILKLLFNTIHSFSSHCGPPIDLDPPGTHHKPLFPYFMGSVHFLEKFAMMSKGSSNQFFKCIPPFNFHPASSLFFGGSPLKNLQPHKILIWIPWG